MESVRAWEGLSLSPSLVCAEGSTVWDPGGKPPPPCTFGSTMALSSTITGRTAHCWTQSKGISVYMSDVESKEEYIQEARVEG